jgi:hypothetical protein
MELLFKTTLPMLLLHIATEDYRKMFCLVQHHSHGKHANSNRPRTQSPLHCTFNGTMPGIQVSFPGVRKIVEEENSRNGQRESQDWLMSDDESSDSVLLDPALCRGDDQ